MRWTTPSLLSTCALLACATPPAAPRFAPPAMTAEVLYLPADPAAEAASRPAVARTLTLVATWLDRMPANDLPSLLGRVRLIGTSATADPVLAHTALAGLGRIGTGNAVPAVLAGLAGGRLAESAPAATSQAVVQGGMRTRVALVPAAAGRGAPAGIACEIDPSGDGEHAALAVELHGQVRAHADDEADSGLDPAHLPAARPLVTETVALRLLDPLTVGDAGTLLLLRMPGDALVCALHVQLRREAPEAGALARAAQALQDARQAGVLNRARLSAEDRTRHEFESAVASLALGHRQRAALVFLSQVLGAPLAADLALASDPILLLDWAHEVHEQLAPHPRPDAPALAWTLERTACHALLAATGEGLWAPALRGVLLRHAGELGNAPDVLAVVLDQSADVATFQRRILEENLAFLSDNRPGARARASDWLRARGRLPAAYDPLAAPAARRAALEALDAAEAAR